MEHQQKNIWHHYWFVLYAIIVFIACSILFFSWFDKTKFDVTEEQRFSVSKHSFKIIEKISERIVLKLYISDVILTQMPTMKKYVEYVQDFLQQLEKQSNGRLKVSTKIMQSFSEEEDEAITLGLKSVPFKDGAGVFFGIIAENMVDGEGIIPFLTPDREAFIEYDIARLIQGVIEMEKVKIAVTSSLPLETGNGGTMGVLNNTSNPYYIFKALQQRYDLIGLSDDYHELLNEKSRPKVALILHPRPLSKKANDALKQYLATGGRALIAIDPLSEAVPLPIGSTQQNAEIYSDMPDLLKTIGLSYNNKLIILDDNHARKMVNPKTSRSDKYLAWLKFTKDNFSTQNPTMTSVSDLSFLTVGFLYRISDFKGNLDFIPLIYSLKMADFTNRDKMLQIKDLNELEQIYQEKTPYNLAMLVTGKISNTDSSVVGSQDMAAIVIADSDFLDDRLWLQKTSDGNNVVPFADNLNLLLNYVDYLAGDDALIALRGKKTSYRPLTYLNDIKQEAQNKFQEQEKLLQNKIDDLRKNIAQINKDYAVSSGKALPDKINNEVQQFSQALVVLRKQLREVRRDMDVNIKNSERGIKLINMIVVPLCFGSLAIIILFIRKSKSFKKTHGGSVYW